MSKIRVDIQALRGIAIALVVLDHFGLGPFRQGYLGVDIFFVISGFLITGIISKNLINNTFSFKDFYFRRARRLLPAAYTTIFLTTIASIWFINSIEMKALMSQVVGALTFTTNFVLNQQTGYFDVAAVNKPFLHMWSLAVEEQFYLLFPTLLFFIPRWSWIPTIIIICILSFAGCIYQLLHYPTAAFYLLPTRAWELFFGSLGALTVSRWESSRLIKALFWPSLLALLSLSIWSTGLPHPSLDALIVCAATLIIILAKNNYASKSIISKLVANLGNISYSLYLVHWPIVVFMRSAYTDKIPDYSQILALALSLLLAFALNKFVEEPFRRIRRYSLTFGVSAILAPILLISVQFLATNYVKTDLDFIQIRRPNYGLDPVCDNSLFKPRKKCMSSNSPDTLVWGDSFAMHSIPGIVAYGKTLKGIIQATYSACPPFLETAPYNPHQDKAERVSKICIQFNTDVIQYIEKTPTIKKVILAASFWQYTIQSNQMLRKNQDGTFSLNSTSLDIVKEDLGRTIQALQQAGKEVILIAPPPAIGNQNVSCMERVLAKKFVFGNNPKCEVNFHDYLQDNAGVIALTENVEEKFKIHVIRLSDALCSQQVCQSILDGVPIYRDSVHLSYLGSDKVFKQLSNI